MIYTDSREVENDAGCCSRCQLSNGIGISMLGILRAFNGNLTTSQNMIPMCILIIQYE